MKTKKPSPRIFFGWWTVIAGGVIDLWSAGFQVYGISALFKPISQALGFSRTQTSIVSSVGSFEGGIEGPLAGWITDRYGPKRIIMFGILCMVVALILMNYIGSLWAYIIVWGVLLGTGKNFATAVPFDTTISNWFVRKRGVAMGLKWVLSGLSGVVILPLVAWLITIYDWRITCVIGGIFMAIIGFPLAWFCVRDRRPEYYGLLPDGATTTADTGDIDQMIDRGVRYASELREIEFTVKQAVRTPAYWLLIVVQAVHGLVAPVMGIHLIPFLTDIGIDPVKAAGMMALMIGAGIPARFVGGIIADRLRIDHMRFLIGTAYLLQAVGVAIFLRNQTMTMIFVWFVIYGVGQGTGATINPIIMARYFGRKAYGSIRGSATMWMTPIRIVSPIYAGWLYDTTGSYMNAFILFAIMLAVSGVLACFILPPKPPAVISDIHQII